MPEEIKWFITKDFVGHPTGVVYATYVDGRKVSGNFDAPLKLSFKYPGFSSLQEVFLHKMCNCGNSACQVNLELRKIVLEKLKTSNQMGIETIDFKGAQYPLFQSKGFAAQFAFPFANHLCKGTGYDVGYYKEEWKLPGAMGIEPSINPEFHATNLPPLVVDYIFSSHCLEHTPDWVAALDHWTTKLRSGGVLFLYLPSYSQEYWRSWNNRKHVHNLSPELIRDYLIDRGCWIKIKTTGDDLNNSFYVIAEKI